MNKFPHWYDIENKECKICGILMPADLKQVIEHSKEIHHLVKEMEFHANKPQDKFMKIKTETRSMIDSIFRPINDLLEDLKSDAALKLTQCDICGIERLNREVIATKVYHEDAPNEFSKASEIRVCSSCYFWLGKQNFIYEV